MRIFGRSQKYKVCIIIFGLLAFVYNPMQAATVTLDMVANINQFLIGYSGQPLNFGSITANQNAGSITIDTLGGYSASGSGVNTSQYHYANFSVSSNSLNQDSTLVISFPAEAVLSDGNAAMDMKVDNFTVRLSNSLTPVQSSSSFTCVLGTSCNNIIAGATLHLSPNQEPGAYSGSMNITILYQ